MGRSIEELLELRLGLVPIGSQVARQFRRWTAGWEARFGSVEALLPWPDGSQLLLATVDLICSHPRSRDVLLGANKAGVARVRRLRRQVISPTINKLLSRRHKNRGRWPHVPHSTEARDRRVRPVLVQLVDETCLLVEFVRID